MAAFDQRAFDRAQDAFNLARKKPVQQKTIVFIIPSKVKLGVVKTVVRFPYDGIISDIYATCGRIGIEKTSIDIEKCSQSDYDNDPVWKSIFLEQLSIGANEKSSNSSDSAFSPANKIVCANDHFRVNISELGANIEDITIEITIDI